MWLLSCEGDVLGGKRSWLRPGSVHLLGRTSGRGDGEQIRFIDQKSVSRKHLLIKVDEVDDAAAGNLYTRPRLTVTDGSKTGTHVNGDKIRQEEKELTGNEYTVQLGSYAAVFKIEWKPVVISNNSKKSPDRELLAGTGIKVVKEFVASSTTHTVGKKRNSPAVLSALVCARWVVNEGFVKALAESTRKIESDDIAVSPLEQDFDANWPNEEDYPILASTEPVHREDSYLQPNGARAEVFQDFVFVFLTQAQYDTLLPVITSGGGKALLHEVEQASDMSGLISFVTDAAGHKKHAGQLRLTQQTGQGGVVLVQHSSPDDWAVEFTSGVDEALGQRSLSQSEFLDAILTLDTTSLRKPVAIEQEHGARLGTVQTQPSSAQPDVIEVEPSSPSLPPSRQDPPSAQPTKEEPESSAPTYKRRTRTAAQARFKGFVEIDPSELIIPSGNDKTVETLQAMDVDGLSQVESRSQTHAGRKRPASSAVDAAEEGDALAGQAEFKRRRLEEEARAKKPSTSGSREDTPANGVKTKARKGKQREIDVKAELQKQRREEEERRRKDEEELRAYHDDVEVSQLRDLAIVEEMELPTRDRTSHSFTQNTQSDRWKPEWEGRKNFKRFRRQGQEASQESRPRSRLIVTVHKVGASPPVPNMMSQTTSSSRSKSRRSQSQAQTQTQTQTLVADDDDDGDEDDATRFRRHVQQSLDEDAEDAELADEFADDFHDGAAAPTTSSSKSAARKKRAAAPTTQSVGPPAKRARQTTSRAAAAPVVYNIDDDDDDSDDDQLKFRRKKR